MPARTLDMDRSSPTMLEDGASEQATRRRSGRVVRAPTQYEDMVSSQTTKRKRADDGDQEPGDGSSDEDTENESGPDEEELREKRRAKRTKATKDKTTKQKRPKANGAVSELAIRSAPAKSKTKTARPRKPGRSAVAGTEDATGLYADVFAGTNAIDDVTAGWLVSFNAEQVEAMRELVNFVLRACGCTIEVDSNDIEDPDNAANRLTDIQDEFQAQNIVDYPLITRSGASFRRTLTDFVRSLIRTLAAAGTLYNEEDLLENIQSWVVAMSSSANRAFRHTASVVSLEIMSALCEVGHSAVDARAKSLRQFEGEKKKGRTNQGRLGSLKKQGEEHAKHATTVDRLVKDWFDTVFVHRYRDVNPKIRQECVISLADWVLVYPELFFDGQYLRYLGWLLSDSNALPRHEVVRQLIKIYKHKDKISGLRQFTEKFRPRVVEMAVQDADPSIRASAVALLDVQRADGMLEPDDVDTIGRLIYDSDSRVRLSVVDFFVANVDESFESRIEELGGLEIMEEHLPAEKDDDFETPQGQWLRLKALAEILEAYDAETEEVPANVQRRAGIANDVLFAAGLESRTSLALQALYPSLASTLSWETIAGYLLFDHSSQPRRGRNDNNNFLANFKAQCRPTEVEEQILLELLNVAVKTALTEVVDSSAEKRTKQSRQEAAELKERQEEAAQRLSNLIPRLLKKFGSTPGALAAILRLERVLNLDKFQELRHDSATFKNFVDEINRFFLSHQSPDVLSEARNALLFAKSDEDLREMIEGKEHALKDDITRSLVTHCKDEIMDKRGSIAEPLLAEISTSLLRLANLASISDCTSALETARAPAQDKNRRKQRDTEPVAPLDLLIKLIDRGKPTAGVDADLAEVEDECFQQACRCLLFYFLWTVQKICADPSSATDTEINSLAERRETIFERLGGVIHTRPTADNVRVAAAELMLDMQTAFTQTTKIAVASNANAPDLSELTSRLTRGAQAQLLAVFNGLEKDYARKTRRRLDAAPVEDDAEPESTDDDEPEASDDEQDLEAPQQEADEDDDAFARRKARAAEARQHAGLVAEQRLCSFAGRLVLACLAGAFALGEGETRTSNRVQKRIARNQGKLGQNFKGVIAMLADPVKAMTGAGRKRAQGGAAKAPPKSQARVEIEDDDEEGEGPGGAGAVDEDEEEVRRREMDVDGMDEDVVVPDEAEVESLISD